MIRIILILSVVIGGSFHLTAQKMAKDGPLISGFGSVFTIDNPEYPTPADQIYKVVFDVASGPTDPAQLNPAINTLARFLNMHAQAGIPKENLLVIAVFHGGSARHTLHNHAYRKRYGVDNPHIDLFRQLKAAGAELYLCGQSMHAREFQRAEIVSEVDLALSAMTIIIQSQAAGYSLIRL